MIHTLAYIAAGVLLCVAALCTVAYGIALSTAWWKESK